MGFIHPPSVTGLGAEPANKAELAAMPRMNHTEERFDSTCPFPLHLICGSEQVTWKSIGYEPGRIVIRTYGAGTLPDGTETATLLRADLHEFTETTDVVYAPMYEGTTAVAGPWPPAPTLGYDHNLEVLRDVGPQVRAVLVGNRQFEAGCIQDIERGGGDNDERRATSSMRICQFVEEAAGMARSVSSRLGLGFVDFQIILDCYWAPGQPLRAKLIEHDVLVFVFLGFKLWPKMAPLHMHDHAELILPKAMLDEPPYPAMTKWLEGLEAWSGVDYLDGLRKGNPQRCFDGGFKAGIIGQLPDGTM